MRSAWCSTTCCAAIRERKHAANRGAGATDAGAPGLARFNAAVNDSHLHCVLLSVCLCVSTRLSVCLACSLKCLITKHLPVLVFGRDTSRYREVSPLEKEKLLEATDSGHISSIYLDSGASWRGLSQK